MENLFSIVWRWIVRVFSLPKAEGEKKEPKTPENPSKPTPKPVEKPTKPSSSENGTGTTKPVETPTKPSSSENGTTGTPKPVEKPTKPSSNENGTTGTTKPVETPTKPSSSENGTTKPVETPTKTPSNTEKPKPTVPNPSNKPNSTSNTEGSKLGFNMHFLGFDLPLPKCKAKESPVLDYRHFTILMNTKRKMPFFTAVNIDAVKYNKLKSQIPSRREIGADNWIIDPRVDKADQLPKSFYTNNDFDLGHMVRREDALWGDNLEEALAANNDTFYLTNATPQHKDFNRNAERWKGLEDYALRSARQNDLRISVFTGCIFTEKDRKLGTVRIPAKFWKVIVMVKEDGTPSATGYIVNQDDLIEDITERGFVFEKFKMYQIDLKTIENETGLDFGLNHYDPLHQEGIRGLDSEPTLIDDMDKIVF
jgi:DNA/RNA endonuclease G (NUC1)